MDKLEKYPENTFAIMQVRIELIYTYRLLTPKMDSK